MKLFSRNNSYLRKNVFNFSSTSQVKGNLYFILIQPFLEVYAYIQDNLLMLNFPLPKSNQVFFINENYTINSLKDILELELSTKVELDLSQTKLDQDQGLIRYLLEDKINFPIRLIIDEEIYSLTPAYQFKETKFLTGSQFKFSPTKIYNECLELKIDPSHANTLSWLINQVNSQLSVKNTSLTQKEVHNIMRDSLQLLGSPIKDKIFFLQHSLNVCEAELQRLQDEQKSMKFDAERKGYQWVLLIFILSVAQILAFYYGIYIKEDSGWDNVEPFSYTVQCGSVLVGLGFYVKYRKTRGLETIIESYFLNRMAKQRLWREQWEHLNHAISVKTAQKQANELQLMITKNRINYHHYVQEMERRQQEKSLMLPQ